MMRERASSTESSALPLTCKPRLDPTEKCASDDHGFMSHLQSVADEATVRVGAVKEQPVLPADARDD
jgi:hypothetical protein